jgi:hypothetical protein
MAAVLEEAVRLFSIAGAKRPSGNGSAHRQSDTR